MKNQFQLDQKYRTSPETLQAASNTEMTGLIPADPRTESQYTSYLDLYPFLPVAENKEDPKP